MDIHRIRVIPNYRKPWAKKMARKISAFLSREGYDIVTRKEDLAICIGGDGTILYANHLGKIHSTVLGIGTETSYICALRRNNWKSKLLPMLRKDRSEKRTRLLAKITGRKISAINDIVVHSNDFRVIGINVNAGKRKISFEGDGVIVSTPTGSSAYAYSAGGKLLDHHAKKIQIVPICPYKRIVKPIVVNEKTKISIRCRRSSTLIVDGIKIRKIPGTESVKIEAMDGITFFGDYR